MCGYEWETILQRILISPHRSGFVLNWFYNPHVGQVNAEECLFLEWACIFFRFRKFNAVYRLEKAAHAMIIIITIENSFNVNIELNRSGGHFC